ncbi:MAG: GNAT family N-acetyltransferase [Salinivirgaceae bacterium]|nr:GNAT family N-acetyltransferase [Salinivirgaceae bacterium]
MIADSITIRPIRVDEWLPDRCLNGLGPFDPNYHLPESGCPSINYSQKSNRKTLEQLYQLTIDKYGGCGFVAWDKDKIIAYHNFFPLEIAQKNKFYGYGFDSLQLDNTLIHNCLTIVKGDYLRKGISSRLVKESINWARVNNWKRFEVHLVLPDCEKGWQSDQKSCLPFWKKFGFKIFKEYDADKATKQFYGVTKRYSMYLSLDNND